MLGVRHPDPHFATTVAHGFAVLHSFSVGEPALSNKELAARTGLSRPTITRLTYTLAARGLLVFDGHLRRYRLGSTVLTIGQPLMASLYIRQLARGAMKTLAQAVGGAASIGMRDRTRMVYVETSRGHELSGWRPDIGAAVPMLPSAIGRAWLAAAAPPQREKVLGRLRAEAPPPWARHAAHLAQAEADLRDKGFCVSCGDWRPDLASVAVPLRVPQEGETLVFCCDLPSARMSPRLLQRQAGPALLKLVRRIEAELARG